jgi:hypothetical protein
MDYVFGFPQFVRFSWSTASLILEKDAAPIKWLLLDIPSFWHPAISIKFIFLQVFNTSYTSVFKISMPI